MIGYSNERTEWPLMDVLENLSQRECLSRLAGCTVGRIVFTEHALPAIRPMSYLLIGGHIVVTTPESGLADRLDGQVVAFQIDQTGRDGQAAWSVVVTGTAHRLQEPGELVHPGRARAERPRSDGERGVTTTTALGIACGEVKGILFKHGLAPLSEGRP